MTILIFLTLCILSAILWSFLKLKMQISDLTSLILDLEHLVERKFDKTVSTNDLRLEIQRGLLDQKKLFKDMAHNLAIDSNRNIKDLFMSLLKESQEILDRKMEKDAAVEKGSQLENLKKAFKGKEQMEE